MRKIVQTNMTDLVATIIILLLICIAILISMPRLEPKIIVHKVMSDNQCQLNIVVYSKGPFLRFLHSRELYVSVWQDSVETNRYLIYPFMSVSEDYKLKIKEITLLSNSDGLKVEFYSSEASKSRTGVDLYKLPILKSE